MAQSFEDIRNLSASAPNFDEILPVAIKQGGTAEAAIDGINETISSIINRSSFLVLDWFPRGEMAKKQ
jgi:hypothetical protein